MASSDGDTRRNGRGLEGHGSGAGAGGLADRRVPARRRASAHARVARRSRQASQSAWSWRGASTSAKGTRSRSPCPTAPRARPGSRRGPAASGSAAIFKTNFAEYDAEWVFLHREALRRLCRLDAEANVVEIKLDTIRDTEGAARAIEKAAGPGFSVTDWRRMNSGLFSALAIQQTTLFLVIGLIVAVSTFNVVSTLVMTVQEKKRDIGVLSALGAEPRFFSRVFLMLGALLGGTGVAAGIVFGWLDLPGGDGVPAALVPAGSRGDLFRLFHPLSRSRR